MRPLAGQSRPAFSLVETVLSSVIAVIVLSTLSVSMNALTYGPTAMARRARLHQEAELIMQRIASDFSAAKVIHHVVESADGVLTTEIRFATAVDSTGVPQDNLEPDPNSELGFLIDPETDSKSYTQYLDVLKYRWVLPESSGPKLLVRMKATAHGYEPPPNEEDTWAADLSILSNKNLQWHIALECEIQHFGVDYLLDPAPRLVNTANPDGRQTVIDALAETQVTVRAMQVTLSIEDEDTGDTVTLTEGLNCPNKPHLLGFTTS